MATSKKPQTFFKKEWLELEEFANWLFEVKNERTFAGCKICRTKIKLSIMGRSSLTDHVKGSKYIKKRIKSTVFMGNLNHPQLMKGEKLILRQTRLQLIT